MKHIKKDFALALAFVMVLAMSSLSVFAAGHGTITINNAEADHTYTAYQILKGKVANGKLSDVQWGDDITEAGKTALYTKYGLTGDDQTPAKVAEAIATYETEATGAKTESDSKAVEFANTVGTNVQNGSTGTLSGTTYTISNLDDGYYMIVDTYDKATGKTEGKDYTISRYMVQLVGTATVNNKADKPTVDKGIVDGDDTVDGKTANIGDTINYKVTSKVPEYDGYKEYYMDFKDTMSKGLTFNNDVVVKIGGTALAADAYTVTVGDYSESTGTQFTIHLKDLVSREAAVGAAIEITYSGTVNDKAVIGNTGNPNTMTLDFSNNPLQSGDGTPDNPNDDVVHGTTPESVTKVFVTEIEMTKVDKATGDALAGAVFNVKGSQINKVLVTGQKFVEAADGTFYLLNDGTYTEKEPTAATESQYESTETKYKKENYATTSVQETANVNFQVITGDDGKLKITGLKEGTYTFTEIQAPDGYNLLDAPITVTVESNIDGLTEATLDDFAWQKHTGDDVTVENGVYKFDVENTSGTALPETGGIGTVIFYVLGSILVIGSAIVLISRRRMENK